MDAARTLQSNVDLTSVEDGYTRAVQSALAELAFLQDKLAALDGEKSEVLAKISDTNKLLESLLLRLPDKVRARYVRGRALAAALARAPNTRASDLYNNVVMLVDRRKGATVTNAEVYEYVREAIGNADEKAVSNILAYLARTGRVRRIARGQYLVLGAGLTTSDEIEGLQYGNRLSEHDV